MTGGAGFIGSNLVRALVGLHHKVVVLDDLSTGLESNLDGTGAELVLGSIADPLAVDSAVRGADAIVHLAARGSVPRSIQEPEATHLVNATGTLNVLAAARTTGAHVIFSSSSSVYGANTVLPKREEMWMQPISPYAASKMAAESYALAYREVYDMDVLVLRFFNVYGPWQRPDHDYAAVIPRFAWNGLHGLPIEIHGDGNQTRDFTHVDSVVAVIIDALDRRFGWQTPVNLAFGQSISVNDVIAELNRQLGIVMEVVSLAARAGDVRNSMNDPALLTELFPQARAIAFSEGIASVLDWLR